MPLFRCGQFLAVMTTACLAAPLPLDGVLRPCGGAQVGALCAYIPPPRGGNHAATLAALPSGGLVAAWFTGGEGTPNCSIAVALLDTSSTTWTPGYIAATVVNQSAQNPVLFHDSLSNELVLWHTIQNPSAGESSSFIYRAVSTDGGASFAPTRVFYAVPGAFTRNAPLVLPDDGRVLLPIYNSTPGAIPDYPIMLISDAAHKSWRAVRAPGADLIQPTVVSLAGTGDGRLRGWLRDENQTAVYVFDSADGGETWSAPAATALPNNNAAVQALRLRSGAIAMVYDAQRGPGTPRSPLVIALSDDGGSTWPVARTLQQHDDNATAVGQYSYPALVQREGHEEIEVAFTYDEIAIKHMRFSEAWVRAQ